MFLYTQYCTVHFLYQLVASLVILIAFQCIRKCAEHYSIVCCWLPNTHSENYSECGFPSCQICLEKHIKSPLLLTDIMYVQVVYIIKFGNHQTISEVCLPAKSILNVY
jgi:hypothetical protein